jgi:hypothetical protein
VVAVVRGSPALFSVRKKVRERWGAGRGPERGYSPAVEPRTVWQEQDGVQSGGSGLVRAVAFPMGEALRGAVTLTVSMPAGFWRPTDGGGASATLLLNPDEAAGFASWLDLAAQAAAEVGPPLYDAT